MLMEKPIIRLAIKKDLLQLVDLCNAHAAYEKADYDPAGKAQLLSKHLFENKGIVCLVAEQSNRLLGYATIVKQFSTWDADHYYYMDCLYLTEDARGQGMGKQMMNEIKLIAIKEGINIQWQTPDFNTNAIGFYKALGAESKTKERFFWTVI
jgi:GNAT superfamily N-acetyltransferase